MNLRSKAALLLIFTFTAAWSCSKSLESKTLATNVYKWNKSGIQDYEFSFSINCFCPPERTGPHLIRVTGDLITAVNGGPYEVNRTGPLMTIPQLFNFIQKSLDRKPYRVTISYHPVYGFPENIYFDFDQTMADEEIGYTLSGFKKNG